MVNWTTPTKGGIRRMQKKALIAMSGGVDSSVAAYLASRDGFSCIGATMQLHPSNDGESQINDARSVAQRLDIPFYTLDLREEFRCEVMDHFVQSYEDGLTPNPCVICNQKLKFGHLLDAAIELGCDYVVTGHYARIAQDPETGRYYLRKALDEAKDQSYFLACIAPDQLSHIRFPLGGLTKEQVRQIALEQGFLNAQKRDSQDICFIPDGDYASFLRRYTDKVYPTGNFLDLQGKVVGQHSGAVDYTLGQRKGLGLALGQPGYVCQKDMQANTVTVGPNSALFSDTLIAKDWHWFCFDELTAPLRVTAKARSRHIPQAATVYPLEDGMAKVVFDTPQRALTPGQAVVLYDGDLVLGGGTIC